MPVTASTNKSDKPSISAAPVKPGTFDPVKHWHPRAFNAQMHPTVAAFFSLSNERIVQRYTHLNPHVDANKLRTLLSYKPTHFRWAGSDLFNVNTMDGKRQMVLIEMNSCPNGLWKVPRQQQKQEEARSLPVSLNPYHVLLKTLLGELSDFETEIDGDWAVIYENDSIEGSGYAATLADLSGESVWLAQYREADPDPPCKWDDDGIMYVRDAEGVWHPIRACFRYVSLCPWRRIPITTRTRVVNSMVPCLAGGYNKALASKAYTQFNDEHDIQSSGLQINFPYTITDVEKEQVPQLVRDMGGHAVIKIPCGHSGKGVYTITNEMELADFMAEEHYYGKFIAQSLIGGAGWSSQTSKGKFFHAGTMPDQNGDKYVYDVRMIVASDDCGFRPTSLFARRARKPLSNDLSDTTADGSSSWEILGTNISSINPIDGSRTVDDHRVIVMDIDGFDTLGLGMDDLIDGYIQTVLATIAIDRVSLQLQPAGSDSFDLEKFQEMNPDPALIAELKMQLNKNNH
ncbi:hypothetical protein GQ42DRAFT_147870 [Ramicandelaber brevisporus]|nr:hypothetical protein GQ42DRAFT_147870 [Ramicandelaber brevisporus]